MYCVGISAGECRISVRTPLALRKFFGTLYPLSLTAPVAFATTPHRHIRQFHIKGALCRF
jgi:hypothetical protein